MTDIKLTYFNARGRAEIIRLILAYSGEEYDDSIYNGFKSTLLYSRLD